MDIDTTIPDEVIKQLCAAQDTWVPWFNVLAWPLLVHIAASVLSNFRKCAWLRPMLPAIDVLAINLVERIKAD